jgi:hypothetical protein
MSTRLDHEIAEFFATLAPERQEQVLEFAHWLRENEVELPDRLRSRCPRGETSECVPARTESELERALHGLDCTRQVLMEEYVLSLAEGRGVPGYVFLQFAGTIPEASLRRMEQVIEEEFEQIDHDEW